MKSNEPKEVSLIPQDAVLGVCHLVGGANGIPLGKRLTNDAIREHVATAILFWDEIRRQLNSKYQD
jgi:hypothetical protein